METWTVDEARRFLSVAHESAYGPLWVAALATGLRRGELLGLRWQDLDFDRGVLTVRQTVGRRGRGGSPEIKPPKTPKSRRQVTIPHDELAALREHRRRQLERRVALGSLWQDHDLVFAAANGNPVWPDNLRREYDRLA